VYVVSIVSNEAQFVCRVYSIRNAVKTGVKCNLCLNVICYVMFVINV